MDGAARGVEGRRGGPNNTHRSEPTEDAEGKTHRRCASQASRMHSACRRRSACHAGDSASKMIFSRDTRLVLPFSSHTIVNSSDGGSYATTCPAVTVSPASGALPRAASMDGWVLDGPWAAREMHGPNTTRRTAADTREGVGGYRLGPGRGGPADRPCMRATPTSLGRGTIGRRRTSAGRAQPAVRTSTPACRRTSTPVCSGSLPHSCAPF